MSLSPGSLVSRRDALKQLGALSGSVVLGGALDTALSPELAHAAATQLLGGSTADIIVAGSPVQIAVRSLSANTVRLTVQPIAASGSAATVAVTGALADDRAGTALRTARAPRDLTRVRAGNLVVRLTEQPPTLHVETTTGEVVQTITLSATLPRLTFALPIGPLLAMGEGGPQFDRKGNVDAMRNGQGAFRLATHGTRAPVQWLIGTDG